MGIIGAIFVLRIARE